MNASESFYPAKKIGSCGVDGAELWIGSAADAANADWIREKGFGLVVNCTRHLPFARVGGVERVRVAVDDDFGENNNMIAALPAATLAIARALDNGRPVLVHCHAGMQRSATVAAAALYRMRAGSMKEVVERMSEIKPEIFPRSFAGKPTFFPALKAWIEFCRGRGNPL